MTGTALIDGPYRYLLTRDTGALGARRVLFIMLNPSTATADQDDPTIRRCIGFARTWGCRQLEVANLYAWRATDPDDLWMSEDAGRNIVGPLNLATIDAALRRADTVVAAWGFTVRAPHAQHVAHVLRLVEAAGRTLLCLGRTKSGSPRHPLYVRASAALEQFVGRPA